jgi:hypothetical protein
MPPSLREDIAAMSAASFSGGQHFFIFFPASL